MLIKESMEGEKKDKQSVSIVCLNCDGMAGECMKAQEIISGFYPEKCEEIIKENIWMLDSADTDMDGASIVQITVRSMKRRKHKYVVVLMMVKSVMTA